MYNRDLKVIAQMEEEYACGSMSTTATDSVHVCSLEFCDDCDHALTRIYCDDTNDGSFDFYNEGEDALLSGGKLSWAVEGAHVQATSQRRAREQHHSEKDVCSSLPSRLHR
jgi:hypothetical protein